MSKLLQCKIDVTKIDKNLLFKGKKGTYLDFNVWINDSPDQYGNDCSIAQKTEKGKDPIYIGNGKFYQPKPVQIDVNDSPNQSPDGMPF